MSKRFSCMNGQNAFVLSPKKWIETTQAAGLLLKSGHHGGIFAHQHSAFEFACLAKLGNLSSDWTAFGTRAKRNPGSYQPLLTEEEVPEVYADKQRVFFG